MSIEGIPDGWELVRVGKIEHEEFFIDGYGDLVQYDKGRGSRFNKNYVIIRKIEKPKKPKQYRPFANAAEFTPHRDRWLMHPSEPDKRFAPADYNNEGVWGVGGRMYDYKRLFESGTLFDDGTPFGIEVTE